MIKDISINKNSIFRSIFFLFFSAIILSPYLKIFGAFAISYIILLSFLVFITIKTMTLVNHSLSINIYLMLFITFIVIYPHIIGLTKGVVDINLVRTQFSILAMVVTGFSIAIMSDIYAKTNIDSLVLTKFFIYAIILNSIVVLLEFLIPSFRSFIESLLIPSSRTDYMVGLRFRGIASAGGASLSIAHGLSGVLLYYLHRKRLINPIFALVGILLCFSSLIFIGRSGILLLFVGIFFVHIMIKKTYAKRKISNVIFTFLAFLLIVVFVTNINYLYNMLPSFYQTYSLNLFMNGLEGIQNEGTLNSVIKFIVFPDSYVDLIFGIGNFSGGFEFGYLFPGDPGIMKLSTAYGIPLAFMIYLLIFIWCINLPSGNLKEILFIMIIFFVIFEFKEPFLFKGYSSRIFWTLIGLSLYKQKLISFRRT